MLNQFIPRFPDFIAIKAELAEPVQEFVNKCGTYSDYNFASMFAWNIDDTISVSSLNDNLVVLFRDYNTGEKFLGFIGKNNLDDTTLTLINYSIKTYKRDYLELIPEIVALKLNKHKFLVEEDENNQDYILSTAKLSEFRTNEYRGKKNALNRFIKNHSTETTEKIIKLDNNEQANELLKLFHKWGESRSKNYDDFKDEYEAIKRLIKNIASFPSVRFFILNADEKCIGFIVYEYVAEDCVLLHYDKANTHYVGIFEYMKHRLSQKLHEEGISRINYEQDLGIEGLRKSKNAWHPVDFLKKYKVSLKK